MLLLLLICAGWALAMWLLLRGFVALDMWLWRRERLRTRRIDLAFLRANRYSAEAWRTVRDHRDD